MNDAFTFLISTLFYLYTLALMLRLLLQWVRADFYNPISQFLVKITNPLVRPLRRIIPGYGGIDVSSLLLVVLFTFLKLITVQLINGISFTDLLTQGGSATIRSNFERSKKDIKHHKLINDLT